MNSLLQRSVGGRRAQADHVELKFRADWVVAMEILREHDFRVKNKVLLEIGTGWLPVLPLCFVLAGARHVHSYDLHRHLLPRGAHAVLRQLKPHLGELARTCDEPERDVAARHEWLSAARDPDDVLRRAGIAYHAPADASSTALEDGTVDLVFSNSVLEHVGTDQLTPLMMESARLLDERGLALHSVNCGDHYAYFDRSITPLNYLRFTDAQWRRWNNDLLYQNRLRPRDFVDSAEAAGLHVISRLQTVRPELLSGLPSIPIAEEFRRYPPDELCATSVTIVAKRFPTDDQSAAATEQTAGLFGSRSRPR